MLIPRLAIAISVYNRWLELGGLLDVLRRNWPRGPELYITVISTAQEPEMPTWIDRGLINHLEFGSQYQFPKQRPLLWEKSSRLQKLLATFDLGRRYMRLREHQRREVKKRILRSRTVESIIRGCQHSLESKREYTLHLHAAAWPLQEAAIETLLTAMQDKGYWFAGRGLGKKLIDTKHPAGDIDDNFFIVNNSFAARTKFWQFDPSLDATTVANEGRLARRAYELCPPQHLYLYDDFGNPSDYIFPPGTSPRRVQPFNYYKPLALLRTHDQAFMAQLCREHGLRGSVIDTLIAAP